MLRTLLIELLIYCTTLASIAQTMDVPATPAATKPLVFDWPQPTREALVDDFHNIDIVTLNEPGKRQHCHARAVTADTVTCRANLHHREIVFRRNDIVALIARPENGAFWNIVSFYSVLAGILAGSFFVPLGVSIALRILTGFLFFLPDDGLGYDHNDILLYQRPNTALTVKLHT